MGLCFFNTFTGRKEAFSPLEDMHVKMYTCGPTVYDYAHIGNFRAYVFEDLLRRYLRYSGYRVTQVMNLTDVDDKTIKGSLDGNVTIGEYTEKYKRAFFEDLDTLKIDRAEHYPEATKHIDEMVALICTLAEKGYTYEKDGSIYFRISMFSPYGRLSKMDISGVRPGARVDQDEYAKEDARDFVLWKAARGNEPCWQTRLGNGRPGWHIECSAMSMKYLGDTFDIHTGGEDNIFPHHENEIAQSEAATGKQFVRYWMHCRFLLVNGEKMSKSKGNFFTLRDLTAKGHTSDAIRYLLISPHYRSHLNLTEEALEQAHNTVKKVRDFLHRLDEVRGDVPQNKQLSELVTRTKEKFKENMDDDLNVPAALACVFDMIRDVNTALAGESAGMENAREVKSFLLDLDEIFSVFCHEKDGLPEEISRLMEKREEARRQKDYAEADRLRAELLGRGISLEDTKHGVRWRRT